MAGRSRPPGGPLAPRPSWLGASLIVTLGLNVALSWMAIQASLVLAHAVWLAAAGRILAEAEPSRIAGQIGVLRIVQAVAGLGAAGLFLAWVHGAHRTLELLGVPGSRAAGDSVRAVLIPGANLVRIPRVVAALWRASAGDRTPPTVTVWVAWWWGLCLATVLLDLSTVPPGRWLLARLGVGGGLPAYVLGELLRIAAAVLTIVVVMRIDRHQRDRCAAWAAAGMSRA